ncbi:hypothetical protein [Vibrio antiquarius]|nr:hypothetical protein [Vibrio antiquarius]EJL6793472.1 hypothetical protein [Vibrio alginolyticus]MCR9545048.1 hypothetical protein [Vibrio antiquarius]HAV1574546.1 hypothetical protein [Vibrio parahaemolyticus]HAV1982890.1 hypothetical protein [Vibrio parahaemolyticus]
MQVPPFPLPSNISKVIHFRVPTVDDALSFADLSPEQEEMHTTQYLNQLQDTAKQDGKVFDSAEWTGEDRRTALWWIFISTREYPDITVSYHCEHCQQDHYVDINAIDLADTSTAHNELPKHTFDARIDGRVVKGVEVRPLKGNACEHLETMAMGISTIPEGTKEHKQAQFNFKISQIAHHVTLPGQPKDEQEAYKYKVEQIRKMAVDTEFRSFFANVEIGIRKQQHGLLTRYSNGQYMLVANHKNCSVAIENGEDQSKLLLVPFRADHFISTL